MATAKQMAARRAFAAAAKSGKGAVGMNAQKKAAPTKSGGKKKG